MEEKRASNKSRGYHTRKSEFQTLQDDLRPASRPITTKLGASEPLEKLMGNFISSFQEILREPVNLETYETK